MGLFAGLDVGTQSVKLVVYDPGQRGIVASAGQPLDLAAGDDGSREQRSQRQGMECVHGRLRPKDCASAWSEFVNQSLNDEGDRIWTAGRTAQPITRRRRPRR